MNVLALAFHPISSESRWWFRFQGISTKLNNGIKLKRDWETTQSKFVTPHIFGWSTFRHLISTNYCPHWLLSCLDWDWSDNINKWCITYFVGEGSENGILLNYLWKESKRYEDVWGVALFWAPAASWGAGDGHLIDIFQQVNSKDFPSGLPFYQTQVW